MKPAHRLAVLADLHGNLSALEAVLNSLPPVDAMLVAGDLAGGPWQNEIIARLEDLSRRVPLYAISGNGDQKILALLEGPDQPRRLMEAYSFYGSPSMAEMQLDPRFSALRWFARHLSLASRAYLESLPEGLHFELPGADPIRLVHGSPASYNELVIPRLFPERFEEILSQVEEPVLICAHSHEPWVMRRTGRLAINPGAVSCPLDGRVGAQYALLNWSGGRWDPELFHIAYNIEDVCRGYADCGLLSEAPPAREFLNRLVNGCGPTGPGNW